MNSTLLLLAKLKFKGGCRKLVRALKTPKGALLALVTAGFLGSLIIPSLVVPRAVGTPDQPVPGFDNLMLWMVHPAALFGFWLLDTAGSNFRSPLEFSLAEVEFLFSGPFTRRRLLVYKLLVGMSRGLWFAVLMQAFLWRFLWWPASLAGLCLLMSFIHMSTVTIVLALDRLGASAALWRRAVIVLLVVAFAWSMWQSGALEGDKQLAERISALVSAPAARVILAPFVVFNRLIVATDFGQLTAWGSAALAMTLAMLFLILRLDANFLEASLTASQRRYDLIERARRSGGIPALALGSRPRLRLPQFPRLLGAGPIARRQLLQLLRSSGWLFVLIPAIMAPLIPTLFSIWQNPTPPVFPFVFVTAFIAFFVTAAIPLGLRTDLDHVDTIKTLPIGGPAIVCGSVFSAVLYPVLVQCVAVATISILWGGWTTAASLALAFCVPLNLLVVAADSVIVLLFPSVRRVGHGDVLIGAWLTLVMSAKLAFVAATTAIAALPALAIYLLFGQLHLAMVMSGWLVLILEGIATVWCAAMFFDRFDPSSDTTERT